MATAEWRSAASEMAIQPFNVTANKLGIDRGAKTPPRGLCA